MCTKGKHVIFIVPLFYRGSGGRGPSRERILNPRTKFSPVSVHSSLVVLHFAEKVTGDHFSYFPIQKDTGKIICNFVGFFSVRNKGRVIYY